MAIQATATERPARRAGWVMLAAAGMAGFLGLMDPGALSHTTAYADDGRLRLEYSVLDRAAAATKLRLWVAPGQARRGELRLRLSASYVRTMRVMAVRPEPLRVETTGQDVVFVFRQKTPRDPSVLELDLQPADLGRYSGSLAIAGDAGPDGRPVSFTQYMVP